jgi:cysteinyl-tRNA synthetase
MEGMDLLDTLPFYASSSLDIATWRQSCYDAMNDDFNTPILIAQLFEGIRFVNLLNDKRETISSEDLELLKTTLNEFIFDVLGIKNQSKENNATEKLEGTLNLLIEMRNEARANKNFKLSDAIRDKLLELDIQLKDTKEGTTFTI